MLDHKSPPEVKLFGLQDIKRPSITGWQEFLKEGNQFLATAEDLCGLPVSFRKHPQEPGIDQQATLQDHETRASGVGTRGAQP